MAGQPPLQMPQGLPAQPPPIQPQLEIPQLRAPPGGAAPLPIGGMTRRPSTFLEFYQEPLSDPCQGRYANILNRFNPESAHAVAANVLLEQVVSTPAHVPQAYLCCALSRQGLRVYCMHMPSKFAAALDGSTTPWDNLVFAFLGDVVQGMTTTVTFPSNAFQATANIRWENWTSWQRTPKYYLLWTLPIHKAN
jgi:hypothetical protein